MKNKGLGSSQLIAVSLIAATLLTGVALAGDTASDTLTASLAMGNAAPVVSGVTVQNGGSYNPTSCSTTAVAVRFTGTDANGWEDIDLSSTSTNCTLVKGGTTVTLSAGSCTKISNSSATVALFQCTGDMQYYYATGADWAVTCNAIDTAAASDSDTGSDMTYTRLESINTVDASAAWTGIIASSTEVGSDSNPITTNNCGNAYFGKLNVTAYDLAGAVTPTEKIAASDFTANDADAANGDALSNGAAATVTDAALLIGSGANENIYFYLEQITTPVSAQTYNGESAWQIMVYEAANANP